MSSNNSAYTIGSVEKALAALEALGEAGSSGHTLLEIATRLGCSKSSAFALLRTLGARGYVRYDRDSRRYTLGIVLVRLGQQASSLATAADLVMPELRELTQTTGLTSRVAFFDGDRVVIVGQVDAPGAVLFASEVGREQPLHCSAVGKAILSSLADEEVLEIIGRVGLPQHNERTITDPAALIEELHLVSSLGYSVDNGEDIREIFCVGAPLYDHSARCAGAISVAGIRAESADARIPELGEVVKRHARRASRRLGATHLTSESQPSAVGGH